MADEPLERKIYFYWINAGKNTETGDWNRFDPEPPLDVIRSLKPGEDGLYMPVKKTADHLLAVVDDIGNRPKVRWVRARRADLPEVELAGQFDNLKIAEAAGLADRCHLVFFEDNVIGADFNGRAPRLPAFARYLIKKAGVKRIAIENLISRDMMRRLDQMETIHMLDVRVIDPQLPVLDNTPFHASFQNLMTSFGAYDVEVVLRRKPRTGEDLKGLKQIVRRLARSADREGPGAAPEKLRVAGRTSESEEDEMIDLLNSKLHALQDIRRIQSRSRSLDIADAYRAIEEAYDQRRDEIRDAVSYRLVHE